MKQIRNLFFLITCLIFSGQLIGQDYYVYVTAESEDEVAVIKFDGKTARAVETIKVGVWPAEIEGPHGITVAPDGKHWYLTMAHGNPYGTLYKYSTETNEVVDQTTLGLFPATMQISKATGLLYCVNFNLHGDMVPSSVSVVDPETMTELKRITTGAMPHGSRISPDGMKQYSVAMMSGELFEIDAFKLEISRTLSLDEDEKEMHANHQKMDHSQMDHSKMDHSKMNHQKHGMQHKHSKTKPTWVIPHPTNNKVYIAGNGINKILEVDLKEWKITRKFETGKGPYNVEITPDGTKMVATYKSDGATGVWDIEKGTELAKVQNSRKVSHGIAISPDSRYAFVSVEGIGGEPGSVDVIDLETLRIVDTANIGKQAGGIVFWKMEKGHQ
ncbi:YncE family protein [Fulvivirgaceae bacterium BMA10]|uniref:YncE family protein n=1 Tax=Splendidivirga corallicola TaxID=3051826 RepID=A0ABT8KJH2_9BACT|nr:YncE family protein [Fulvivirgaceae bacterium BMA10]